MSLISLALYIPLQIIFFPVALLGVLLVAYRQLLVSKRLGVSQTAIEIINARWTMHLFGIRADEATDKLIRVLPNTSIDGLWLTLFPLWLKFKVSGELFLYPRQPEPGKENIGDIVVSRTKYFDQIIESSIGNVNQFIVLGAGYDARAYGELKTAGVTIFELDHANIQAHKQAALNNAGIQSDHVHFVPVNFSTESIFEKLDKAGFDRNSPTLFLWEGVTLYLSEADVRKTMQDVCNNAAKGSVLLADIYADYVVKMGKTFGMKQLLDYTNEGLGFSLPFATQHEQTLTEFIESESMSVGVAHFLGYTNKKGPFMSVVEMRVE
ncbi:MAG: class I SAM-dependent methyltransferase [Pseudomonadota bacterium]